MTIGMKGTPGERMREKQRQNNIMKRVPGSRRPDTRISKRYGESKKKRKKKGNERIGLCDSYMCGARVSIERSGHRVMYDGVHAT